MKAFYAPLSLRRPGLRAAAHPLQLSAIQGPPLAFCGKRHFLTRRPILQIYFVVSLVAIQLATGQLQNDIGDPIQKIAIVRHHKNRAAKLFEISFQPLDGITVDMVGRLVQDENIAGIGENTRHGDPFPLAAGQCTHFFLEVSHTELMQHGFALVITLCGSLRRQITDRLLQYGFVGIISRGLRQIADSHAAGQNNSAAVCLLHACRNPQKCGLAGAVHTDQTDLITFVDGVGKLRQQRACRIGFGDLGCVQ